MQVVKNGLTHNGMCGAGRAVGLSNCSSTVHHAWRVEAGFFLVVTFVDARIASLGGLLTVCWPMQLLSVGMCVGCWICRARRGRCTMLLPQIVSLLPLVVMGYGFPSPLPQGACTLTRVV